ncbi:MAG: M15 family metallopeptidase [Pseudolabrys sp.]
MKVAALAAIGAFIILPAEAVERHGENSSPAAICDNDGHCKNGPGIKRTIATAQHQPSALDANGNTAGIVISGKTGARARVGVAYAARFQAYIDDLETNHGARVLFMGGIRPGRCSISSEHPCGKALDVCQVRRGAVDPRCNLPGRDVLGEIAASHGLFEGGRWCNSDYGHAQIGVTAAACGDRRVRIVQK